MIAVEEATDTRLLLGPVRARVGGLDWQVAGTQWERCAALRVFGFVTSVPGWQDSVARGRQLRGAWLHSAVEERCGLGFTGCEVTRDSSGNVIILAQNRKNGGREMLCYRWTCWTRSLTSNLR